MISFGASEYVVIAVGDNGTILRSQGLIGTVGNLWTIEASNTTKNLYGVSLPSLLFGFTIGQVGTDDNLPGPASFVNHNLSISTNAVTPISDLIPDKYNLSQNYPNPFNPYTRINFSLPSNQFVTIKIYDMLGKEVSTLVNEYKQAGVYYTDFKADNLSSGIYFYSMRTSNFVETKRMVLVK
jgi:hypothetical protein